MTISYNWLCDYLPDQLPVKPSPQQLGKILTSVGLEVESLSPYESIKGGLAGLIVGEVLTAVQHPNADKLKLTTVNIGQPEPLHIVCGAPNVAVGQKVIVAPIGATLCPETGEPFTIKAAKIRGSESQGMLCAEDEIGLGRSHDGLLILPADLIPGTPLTNHFKPYSDFIYEIGLTPNHMDAMSHIGVARDVCAYLSNQDKKEYRVKLPTQPVFAIDNRNKPVKITIENRKACARYSGLSISGIQIKASPQWMQDRLKAVGVRPINNVVDITNFVLQETGQPLHAYDLSQIRGHEIRVKNLPAGTPFITLDGKERKLDGGDLMICDESEPLCIAGVFGGMKSGISDTSTALFLESAWFNPQDIRRTSFRHGLRTEAAVHFEKGMDISGTVPALKRAAALIREYAGGQADTEIADVYPEPFPKEQVLLKFHYLKKLSGKNYHPLTVKHILISLGFDILREGPDDLLVAPPYHKPDIQLPADIVEEIMRIDGYDHIDIPTSITISPSVETNRDQATMQEKVAGCLVGLGFNEIFTNSITNSAYYGEEELKQAVKLINNLSAELNIMRPSLLETGLESIAWNINRKNGDLRFFEFGKTYSTEGPGQYQEANHCCLYVTGNLRPDSWKGKAVAADFFYLKGVCEQLFRLAGLEITAKPQAISRLSGGMVFANGEQALARLGQADPALLNRFDIRQPVYFADLDWDALTRLAAERKLEFTELPKQLPVQRDLALIVEKSLPFEQVEQTLFGIGLDKLQRLQLFDIFESEKLGAHKKSLAISFTFLDPEKTLTDKEIDGMMNRIMKTAEQDLHAEIRK
ncbi:MAG TPA: phenylalanine--tRNA ligase subunit beta [Puia sp.]|nr:phenylalanine--tRNA ligase subunit beta [Puia sp.]